MIDYIRRVLIVSLLALCVSLLFLSGRAAHADDHGTSSWLFPADGYITDHYGTRGGKHKGVDIGGEHGTPVHSVDDGVVTKSYYSTSYGHVIFIKHPNGYETVYGHLQERAAVEGQAVSKGEKIGTMGNTGRSTGTHLHFEIHKGDWTITKDNAIDPYLVFGEGEVGQTVFAKEHDPYQVHEVALKVSQLNNLHPAESSQDENQDEDKLHTVKKGETLWSISEAYGVSTSDVIKSNNLIDDIIISGQQLLIPNKGKKEHIVKQGETLFGIAQEYDVSVEELIGWNGMQENDPIVPAQVLVVQRE
ncbi:peptidoglycan DD-metalloendopeptidase family protein [Bacillus sp. SCS-153A]|uniref:peptidoglycan DD-metalloendopeptidase family protein n=1 Tax=Rossellomorea sedimentorum TaxID=3115294 RepID=UPI00390657E7